MDRRTLTALALVALVILLTPRLFPGKARPVTPTPNATTARGDSVVPATDSSSRVRPAVQALQPTSEVRPIVPAAPVIVTGDKTTFTFQGGSAALDRVTLGAFPSLGGHKAGAVQLESSGSPLLSLAIVSGRDTVPLAQAALMHTEEPESNGVHVLRFAGVLRGATVSLQYAVKTDSFLVRVKGNIGRSDSLPSATYALIQLPGTLTSFEADTSDDHRNLAYAFKPIRDNAKSIKFSSLDPGERALATGPFSWVVAKSKYFLLGVLAADGDSLLTELSAVGGPRTGRDATHATGSVVMRLKEGAFAFEVYAGPQQWRRLVALGRDFESSNPYGGFMQGFVQPFATIVMKILLWMRDNLKLNYGWVLIIFGIAVRLALWPLNQKGMRASMKMQRIQPELNAIQQRYKGDPQKQQAEIMRVYKEHGMSPFSAFSGCLPLFLPLPILFALFFVFQNTIEFRGVPFLWFPDISQKDPVYIVPLTMGLSMFGLSWIGMRNMPPNPQTKMMSYVLPVMMTFLFLKFPSGLNLYYTVQNLAALPQQWLIANERAKSGAPAKT